MSYRNPESRHWSDDIEDPDDPERPTCFMGVCGYLATCKHCGRVVMLDSNHYSHSDSIEWSCEKSGDDEMTEACKAKQRVDALKEDVPAMEYDEYRNERASGFGRWEQNDYGGDY